jgi:hypothetical protein
MEGEQPTIRQHWLEFVHPLADSEQIPGELPIVERPHFDLDDIWSPLHPPR